MDLSLSTLAAATVVFATTNIDDIVILATFFGDPKFRLRAVVIGQFLGIGAITAASIAAAYLALTVPPGWTSLLGAVPLGLGIYKLREWRNGGQGSEEASDESVLDKEQEAEARLHTQALAVAAVTAANGGDNLSVYIPLFASDISVVLSYAIAFTILTGVWCVLGHALVKHPAGAALMQRWGHVLLPVVLIGIGAHILWGARVLLQ